MKALDHFGRALLSAAIRTIFPQSDPFGASVDSRGFLVSFSLDHPFQEGYLRMLDGAMHKLVDGEIQFMEMMGSNAKEMLTHHNQPCPQTLTDPVFIAKFGSIFEVCSEELKIASDFALLAFSQEGKRVTIRGKAFASQQDKKLFEKRYRKWVSHESIARDLELYEKGAWHSRGMLFKQFLADFETKWVESRGFSVVDVEDPDSYAKAQQLDRLTCRGHHYVYSLDALTSSLQLTEKWISLFGFKGRFALGPKKLKKEFQQALERFPCETDSALTNSSLEVQVEDFLGCSHPVAFLEPFGRGYRLSLAPDSDQWIALLLEREKGVLPTWIAPEQVRLLTEKEVDFIKVTKMFRIANIRYTVDLRGEPLKEKVYRALRVNVPCVMVFGKREEKAGQMTIRALSSKKSGTIDLTHLQRFLSERHFEN